jgi:hypothetical protein
MESYTDGRAGRVWSTFGQLKRERRELALMRLSFLVAVGLGVFAALWTLPQVPVGVAPGEYTGTTAIGLGLVIGALCLAFGWIAAWGPRFRSEPPSEFVRVLLGGKLLVRGRVQFMSRLAAECARGRKGRNSFSVIVVRPGKGGQDISEAACAHLRSTIRQEDVLGELEASELCVISLSTGPEETPRVIERLAGSLSGVQLFSGSRLGGASFGVDGHEAEDLLEHARERLAEHSPGRTTETPPSEDRRVGLDDLPDFLVKQLRGSRALPTNLLRMPDPDEPGMLRRSLRQAAGWNDAVDAA